MPPAPRFPAVPALLAALALAAGCDVAGPSRPGAAGLASLDLALLGTIGPWLLGLAAGALAHRWRPLSGASAALGVLAAGPLLAGVAGRALRVGVWDSLWAGLWLGLGLACGTHALLQRRAKAVALAAAATALALGAAEAAVRAVLPPLPAPGGDAPFFVPAFDPDATVPDDDRTFFLDACAYLDPEHHPRHFAWRAARSPEPAEAVLHLGDSMAAGMGVGWREAFPALLERDRPGLAQLNAAVANTSLDHHLLVARRWLPRLRPRVRLALVHLYENDLPELNRELPCCPGGPLLDWTDAGLAARCERARWDLAFPGPRWALFRSAPPAAVLAAAESSQLARRVAATLVLAGRAGLEGRGTSMDETEAATRALDALRRELAAHGVPLLATLLPARTSAVSARPEFEPDRVRSLRLAAAARHAGVPVLDAFDAVRAAVEREGAERIYLARDDIHFARAGHRVVAAWLREHVRRALDGDPSAPGAAPGTP